jgi:hypothetical protein
MATVTRGSVPLGACGTPSGACGDTPVAPHPLTSSAIPASTATVTRRCADENIDVLPV